MTQTTTFQQRLKEAFAPEPHGLISVVDRLIALGSEHPLTFNWNDGVCRVQAVDNVEVCIPMQRISLYRAIIARVAAILYEHSTARVSPYQGEGEIPLSEPMGSVVTVTYRNNPGDLYLAIAPKVVS